MVSRVINGKTYYYRNGKRVKGWLRLSNGAGRYFDSRTGAMKLGFAKVGGKWYYFEPRTGWSRRGIWTAKSGNVRYFRNTTRDMVTGWVRNTKGERRYFQPFSGIMCKGLKKIRGKWYYFDPDRGWPVLAGLQMRLETGDILIQRPLLWLKVSRQLMERPIRLMKRE
ncbi:MAG: N-acetylmuramoyl-L-alanine amidase family protein [Lachnospiraceae bacterium]